MSPILRSVTAALLASSIAAPVAYKWEGMVPVGYRDPINVITACVGHTRTAVLGRRYSDDECAAMFAEDLAAHSIKIMPCLKRDVPPETLAAFVSFSFNVGPGAFCRSTMVRKANAGDLRGACDELPKWVYAGGRQLPGLIRRRAEERALCLKGLG